MLRKYGNDVTKPLSELAKAINLVDVSTCDLLAAETLISQIEKMNENMLIPTKLDCVVKDDIKDMAKLAIKEANPLYPVPKLWDIEEFEEIYLQIL